MSGTDGNDSAVLTRNGSDSFRVGGDNEFFFQHDGVCSRWIAYTFLIVLFFGWSVNLIYCLVLMRCKRNGK